MTSAFPGRPPDQAGPTRLVLSADDYALSPGVSEGIVELIARGRLSATGCMTVSPWWPEHATWLKPLADQADIGLHLTLTDHCPLGPMPRTAPEGRLPPLGRLMAWALGGRLELGEILAEVSRQVTAFTRHFGRPPAFIDGHHHVQQLPVIREAVVVTLQAQPGAYLRLCREPAAAIVRRGVAVPKALLISQLGLGLAGRARRAGLASNDSFRGIYDFAPKPPFSTLFPRFVDRVAGRTLVMCHPGRPDRVLAGLDSLTTPRYAEYDWLASEACAELLAERNLTLARFDQLEGQPAQ